MEQIQKILDKAPKSIQDKFLIKKRERAIEIVKEKIEKSEEYSKYINSGKIHIKNRI